MILYVVIGVLAVLLVGLLIVVIKLSAGKSNDSKYLQHAI